MKKLLKFAPLCALLLAIVAMILLLAANGLTYANEVAGQKLTGFYSASAVMFGQGKYQAASGGASLTVDFDGKGAWNAVLAFIFGDDLRRDALLLRGDGDGRTVLIRTPDHQDLVPQETVVPAEDIGREQRTCHVTQVDGPVGIRPCYVDQDL